MKAQEALQHFRGKEKYNCAQAVLKAFQHEAGIPEGAVKAASGAGGGKAEGGLCGALFAASVILGKKETNDVQEAFAQKAGSVLCKQIRSLKRISCRDCVSLSAQLTQRRMEDSPS
jgi:hypothetical protein